MEVLTLTPVGVIHSEHAELARTPIQPVCAQGSAGRVEVFPQYEEALDDIEGFSHLHLIYWLHRAGEAMNAVSGARAQDRAFPGRRAARHLRDALAGAAQPSRPERRPPRRATRRELLIGDVDVLDGTPLLDIKPYVEGFDLRVGTRGGWTEQVSREEFVRRGERRPDAG